MVQLLMTIQNIVKTRRRITDNVLTVAFDNVQIYSSNKANNNTKLVPLDASLLCCALVRRLRRVTW